MSYLERLKIYLGIKCHLGAKEITTTRARSVPINKNQEKALSRDGGENSATTRRDDHEFAMIHALYFKDHHIGRAPFKLLRNSVFDPWKNVWSFFWKALFSMVIRRPRSPPLIGDAKQFT